MDAASIIDEARDFHELFSQYDQLPDTMLARELGRLATRMAKQVTNLNPDSLATAYEFDAADIAAALAAGGALALPDHFLVLDGYVTQTSATGKFPFTLVRRYDSFVDFPSGYLMGQKLYLSDLRNAGGTEHGWAPYETIVLRLVQKPAPILALEDEIDFPDIARDALLLNLALWMGGRRRVLNELPHLPPQAEDEWKTTVNMLATRDSTTTWAVRQV